MNQSTETITFLDITTRCENCLHPKALLSIEATPTPHGTHRPTGNRDLFCPRCTYHKEVRV